MVFTEQLADHRYDVLDALLDEVAILDAEGRIVHTNAAWNEFGRANGAAASYRGDFYVAACGGGDADPTASRVVATLPDVLSGARASLQLEYPCDSPDERRWFTMRAAHLPGGGAIVTHTNITARRLAELAAEAFARTSHESKQRIEQLLDLLAEGVVVHTTAGDVLQANRAAEQVLGVSSDQLDGRKPLDPGWELIDMRTDRRIYGFLPAEFVEADHVVSAVLRVRRPDGKTVWLRRQSLRLPDPAEGAPVEVVTTFHDITDLKEAELVRERLAMQDRLVTVGTLAAGIGHEINNPLTFVQSNIDLAIEEVRAIGGGSPSARLHELAAGLEDARRGAERIRIIVRGLRALVRADGGTTSCVPRTAVDISLNIANHELRASARVIVALAETPPVAADESRLCQVLVSLLVNAGQAFTNRDIERNLVSVTSSVEPSGMVAIRVADNGPGIPPELVARIFDPFFTTKPVGEGSGLGLAISHAIVTSLGGTLGVRSRLGEGTTFEILLRAAPAAIDVARAPIAAAPAPSRARVLIIDDEDLVAKTMSRALAAENDVVISTDPREGLRRMTSGEDFDVVFCDLTMPHVTGDELYEAVRRQRPDLAQRFVFVTGGVLSARIERFLSEVENERLDKPVSPQNLRAIARRWAPAAA